MTRLSIHAIAAGAILAAGALAAATPALSDTLVYRGGTAGPAAEYETRTKFGVTEIRGTVAAPAETAAAVPAPAVDAPVFVGGRNLWVYDRRTGDVTVCRLTTGMYTGPAHIECQDAAFRL